MTTEASLQEAILQYMRLIEGRGLETTLGSPGLRLFELNVLYCLPPGTTYKQAQAAVLELWHDGKISITHDRLEDEMLHLRLRTA